MGIFDEKYIIDKLFNLVNKEQVNLAKLLITLSTGIIVFSFGLLKPETHVVWRITMVFGLGLLVFSLILGVFYIRACLDAQGHQLMLQLRNKQEQVCEDPKKKLKLVALINDLEKKLSKSSNQEEKYFLWQQRIFYLGLILVTVFGIFHL